MIGWILVAKFIQNRTQFLLYKHCKGWNQILPSFYGFQHCVSIENDSLIIKGNIVQLIIDFEYQNKTTSDQSTHKD